VIAKIGKGQQVGGLLAYLFGEGRAEEHTDQHLVASSAWDTSALQPGARVGGGFDTRALSRWLDTYNRLGQVQGRPPARVWHCSLSLPAADGQLSDAQWREATETLMTRLGLHGEDAAGGGVRWVAVRHGVNRNGNDHVHIAAVLADGQGTPRVPWNDYRTARVVCQELEAKWGLTVTAAADRTAHRAVTRGESERATRESLTVPVRVRVEAEVRAAAAVSRDFGELQRVLAGRGIIATEVHRSESGKAFGVTFTDPSYLTRDGQPVRLSGKALAADLTLPKLQARWDAVAAGAPTAGDALSAAEAELTKAADRIAAGGADAADVTWAAADHLAVTARLFEPDQPDGPLHAAARDAARAGRDLNAAVPARSEAGTGMRMSAMGMWAARGQMKDRRGRDELKLILASQRLMDATHQLRQLQRRGHQAAAARQATNSLQPAAIAAAAATASTPSAPVPSSAPGQSYLDRQRRNGPQQKGRHL